jgi:hypothetical protein
MQCTDLDGTLIEDGDDHDWVRHNDNLTFNAAEHFGQYLAPAGGIIVYNTGQARSPVRGLMQAGQLTLLPPPPCGSMLPLWLHQGIEGCMPLLKLLSAATPRAAD